LELSWSTFLLEAVNFLVLVWILKHFLYKPVLEIVARRRAEVEKTLSDAKTRQQEAQALERQYESRLSDWEAERQRARTSLMREMDEERARRIAELKDQLETEREKAHAAEERRLTDLRDQAEQRAVTLGAQFAARLLGQAATPELEARLLALLLQEIETLPPARLATLTAGSGTPPTPIAIASAFPLQEQQRRRILDALAKSLRIDAPGEFAEDPSLLAGLRITIGSGVIGLNLKDELEGFTRLSDGNG
jgi:F-type H+-transporting ATPase subunit b